MGVEQARLSCKECDQVDSLGLRGVSQRCGLQATLPEEKEGDTGLVELGASSVVSLCDPMGCNPLGSSVHGILQARVLERLAISSSRGSSPPRDGT